MQASLLYEDEEMGGYTIEFPLDDIRGFFERLALIAERDVFFGGAMALTLSTTIPQDWRREAKKVVMFVYRHDRQPTTEELDDLLDS